MSFNRTSGDSFRRSLSLRRTSLCINITRHSACCLRLSGSIIDHVIDQRSRMFVMLEVTGTQRQLWSPEPKAEHFASFINVELHSPLVRVSVLTRIPSRLTR